MVHDWQTISFVDGALSVHLPRGYLMRHEQSINSYTISYIYIGNDVGLSTNLALTITTVVPPHTNGKRLYLSWKQTTSAEEVCLQYIKWPHLLLDHLH